MVRVRAVEVKELDATTLRRVHRYFLRDPARERPPFRLREPPRLRDPPRREGTLPPARRASLRPIAIACLRLVTFRPERPDFSVPRLRSCIARLTFVCAFLPYLAMQSSDLIGCKAYTQPRVQFVHT